MAHRDDEVVTGEIESADREGKHGQIVSIPRGGLWHSLHERRDDAPPLDRRADGARDVQEREERGIREQLAEDLEAALAAPHSSQPVVDEGDPGARNQACSR